MSAVDVLAVIDAAVSKLDSENFFADDLIEARAAVAELISATDEYLTGGEPNAEGLCSADAAKLRLSSRAQRLNRLFAALERAQGAAP